MAPVIDAYNTVVPAEQRGRGLAEVLCDALFAHARRENAKLSVAAVGGAALAGGAQLAASCDLVLAHADHASFTLPGVHGRGYCHTPLVAYAGRLPVRKALELGTLGDTIDAAEATRIGLANRTVPAEAWRAEVTALSRRLAGGYNRNSAVGKATLYQQAAAAEPRTRYRIATDSMVDMFLSPNFRGHMHRFLNRKKEKKRR